MLNRSDIIDRNQIHRNVSKFKKNIAQTHIAEIRDVIKTSPCIGLYFDGKKDRTKTHELNERTMRKHPRMKIEDHYSLVLQPNNLYYTNITPRGSKALHIAKSIFEKCVTDGIDITKILFIGGDGTNLNTGWKNGE